MTLERLEHTDQIFSLESDMKKKKLHLPLQKRLNSNSKAVFIISSNSEVKTLKND